MEIYLGMCIGAYLFLIFELVNLEFKIDELLRSKGSDKK